MQRSRNFNQSTWYVKETTNKLSSLPGTLYVTLGVKPCHLKFAPIGSREISASDMAVLDAYNDWAASSPSIMMIPASIDLSLMARTMSISSAMETSLRPLWRLLSKLKSTLLLQIVEIETPWLNQKRKVDLQLICLPVSSSLSPLCTTPITSL